LYVSDPLDKLEQPNKRIRNMPRRSASDRLKARLKANDNGCLEWQGANSGGYGHISIDKVRWLTHRLAYTLAKGEIPQGRLVCHTCDNPPCCNPDHLFLGSHGDNNRDKITKNRDAFGEKNGNVKLSDEQVRAIRAEYKGDRGQLKDLAERNGVSSDQIRKIVRARVRIRGVTIDWVTDKATKPKDISGYTTGRLTVISAAGKKGKEAMSLVRCSCGVEKVMRNSSVLSGSIVSCGCYSREQASARAKTKPPRLGTGKQTRGTQQ
jgi:hypothetical protein